MHLILQLVQSDRLWKPQLKKKQCNNCITNKERLAVGYFIYYYRQNLLGRRCMVQTDQLLKIWLFRPEHKQGNVCHTVMSWCMNLHEVIVRACGMITAMNIPPLIEINEQKKIIDKELNRGRKYLDRKLLVRFNRSLQAMF